MDFSGRSPKYRVRSPTSNAPHTEVTACAALPAQLHHDVIQRRRRFRTTSSRPPRPVTSSAAVDGSGTSAVAPVRKRYSDPRSARAAADGHTTGRGRADPARVGEVRISDGRNFPLMVAAFGAKLGSQWRR